MQKFKNDRVLLEQAYRNVQEGVMSNIGHATLDLAGLIPGVGEAADITNAIWYCTQNPPNYLFAALSIISCIPTLGDILGKGTKLGILIGKASPEIIKAKRLIQTNTPLIDKIFKQCEKNEKLRPYIAEIRQAFNAFMGGSSRLGPSTGRKPGVTSGKIGGPSTGRQPGVTSGKIGGPSTGRQPGFTSGKIGEPSTGRQPGNTSGKLGPSGPSTVRQPGNTSGRI